MKFEAVNTCDGARLSSRGVIPDESLSVRLTAFCDSACRFCIAEEDMKEKHPFDLDAVVERTLASGAKAISIIGGEPLLFLERCRDYLSAVRPHVEEVYITTNLPKTIEVQWELFRGVMAMADFVTISIQSLDNEVNSKLLKTKQDFDRIGLLEKLLKHERFGEKITVNLNLVKGGVDTKGKFMASYFMLKSWGCKRLRVNELMRAPFDYVNFEKMMGIELPSPYAHGCKSEFSFSSEEMEVVLKRSCFLVEGSLMATEEDALKVEEKIAYPEAYQVPGWRILYEHGEYDHKWREPRKLLPLFVK